MEDATAYRTFLKEYERYVKDILHPTYKEVDELLKPWREPGHWTEYVLKSRLPAPSPVQRVSIRIKRPESVVDKIKRKPSDFSDGLVPDSFRRMNDTLGARVVVYFLSQLRLVDKELRSSDELEMSKDHPPIAYLSPALAKRFGLGHIEPKEKESGYASLHYVTRLRETAIKKEDRPWIEIQVRTLIEDVWAEIEHQLGYKPSKRTYFAVKKQFQLLSNQLTVVDDHFNFLFEELSRFQEEATFNDNDPLNAENLPLTLSEIGVGCAQKEVDGLLKLLISRGIGTVGELRAAGTTGRMERLRSVYLSSKGRQPINFEMVASLAIMREAKSEDEEGELVKAQIEYLDAWDLLKRNLKDG